MRSISTRLIMLGIVGAHLGVDFKPGSARALGTVGAATNRSTLICSSLEMRARRWLSGPQTPSNRTYRSLACYVGNKSIRMRIRIRIRRPVREFKGRLVVAFRRGALSFSCAVHRPPCTVHRAPCTTHHEPD